MAITVDPDVHAGVVRAAREESLSVSAWMTESARRSLRIRDGLAAVAEWEAQHGRFTQQELEEAHARVMEKHGSRQAPHRRRTR